MMSLSLCLVTYLRHAKTAAWIEVPFGLEHLSNPRHIVLDGGPHPHSKGEGKGI